MNVTVREATDDARDLDAMVAMTLALRQFHRECEPGSRHVTPDAADVEREKIIEWLADADRRLVVATTETGELVGMAMGRIDRDTGHGHGDFGYIGRVYVAPEWRSRGVARRLLKRLCDFFAAEKLEAVALHYLVKNELAGRFWTWLGFEPFLMNARTTLDALADRLSE